MAVLMSLKVMPEGSEAGKCVRRQSDIRNQLQPKQGNHIPLSFWSLEEYVFPKVSDFDVAHEAGKLEFTAIEGRCLIKAFQVQPNL